MWKPHTENITSVENPPLYQFYNGPPIPHMNITGCTTEGVGHGEQGDEKQHLEGLAGAPAYNIDFIGWSSRPAAVKNLSSCGGTFLYGPWTSTSNFLGSVDETGTTAAGTC
eukprot:GHVN01105367.1.p3 GENE.GHVN01105367.1~~GHVN01105367.1.p3  ORF type:complete len:111 (+),score=11.30 GHVN01105367.1:464-796(+)